MKTIDVLILIIFFTLILSPLHIFADTNPSNPVTVEECNFPEDMNCFRDGDIAKAGPINANFKAIFDRVKNIQSVGDMTQLKYLFISKSNIAGEGGEIKLEGSDGYNPIHIDNLNGNCRMFGFSKGKYLEITDGSLYVHKNAHIYKDFGVTGNSYLNFGFMNYLSMNKINSSGEGGEIQLVGSDGFNNIQIDNLAGHCRVHGFAEGKYFEITNGSLNVHKNATIGENLHVNGQLTGNAFNKFKKDMVAVVEETTKRTRAKESKSYKKLVDEVQKVREENLALKLRIETLEEKLDSFLLFSK